MNVARHDSVGLRKHPSQTISFMIPSAEIIVVTIPFFVLAAIAILATAFLPLQLPSLSSCLLTCFSYSRLNMYVQDYLSLILFDKDKFLQTIKLLSV